MTWLGSKPNNLHLKSISCAECNLNESVCNHYKISDHIYGDEKTKNNGRRKPSNDKDPNSMIDEFMEVDEIEYENDDWIVVRYDDIWYPGQIKKIENLKIVAQFLHRTENKLFWPKKPDIQNVFANQILCRINLPKKITNKGYSLDEDYYSSINALSANCPVHETEN